MMRTLFVLAIFVPGLIAALQNRFAALLLYLWFALFRPQEWLWIDITNLRLSLILGLLFIIPCLLAGILPDLKHPLGVGTLVFLIIAVFGATSAVNPQISWEWVDYLGRLSLISLLALRLIVTRERLLVTTAVIAASFGFHSAKAGINFLSGGGLRYAEGLAGAFIDNNGYALATSMVIFLLIAGGQNIKVRWLRYVFFVSAGLSIFTIIGTYSRAGFLALTASVLMFVLLQHRRVSALAGLLGCVLVAINVIPIPQDYVKRLDTIQSYEEIGDESAISRLHFWDVAVDMARANPILGVGLRGYESAYNRYDFLNGQYGRERSVHSSHFQVLAETGFLGAAVWTWLFFYSYLTLFRVRARSRNPLIGDAEGRFFFTMANAMIASITAFLIGGAFIALALNEITWLTFILVAALDRLSIESLRSSHQLGENASTSVEGRLVHV